MFVRAPLVEAEQDSSVRIDDLTKIGMVRSSLGLAEERLVPFEATRHIAYADDRPGAFHDVFSRRSVGALETVHVWVGTHAKLGPASGSASGCSRKMRSRSPKSTRTQRPRTTSQSRCAWRRACKAALCAARTSPR